MHPIYFQNTFSGKMSLPYLKYLFINLIHPYISERLFREISGNHFPALERLYVYPGISKYTNKTVTLKSLNCLITKNLKSIQIDGNSFSDIKLSNKDLCSLLNNSGIFVIFGKVKETKMSDKQKKFEEYLKHDPITLARYQMEKQKFVDWCESNIGYGY